MGTNASSAASPDVADALTIRTDTSTRWELEDSDEDDDWVKIEVEEAPAINKGTGVLSALLAVATESSDGEGYALDEEAFPCFAPLLSASQAYATLSGCRFRSSDFYSLPADSKATACHCLAAKLHAAPMVARFAERLRAGEWELVEEMTHAYDVVMHESVRNAMIASFRQLDLWPPLPAPAGIEDSDCDFEDLSAPIPIIAQRAYNDEIRRRREAAHGGGSDSGQLLRKATTASYLVDFVHETDTLLPTASSSYHMTLLQLFGKRVEQWESEVASLTLAVVNNRTRPWCRKWSGFPTGPPGLTVAVEELGLEAAKLWSQCWRETLFSFTCSIFLSATASNQLLRRSLRYEMKTCSPEEEGEVIEEACKKEKRLQIEPMQEMGAALEAAVWT